jgi:hypothetical protein
VSLEGFGLDGDVLHMAMSFGGASVTLPVAGSTLATLHTRAE